MAVVIPPSYTGQSNAYTGADGDRIFVTSSTTLISTVNFGLFDNGAAIAEIAGFVAGASGAGIYIGGTSTVQIDASGTVENYDGYQALRLTGQSTVRNFGTITQLGSGTDAAVYLGNNSVVENRGSITAYDAVQCKGTTLNFTNYGLIDATNAAFMGGSETDTIVNTGEIDGSVILGNGFATQFDSSEGKVYGVVYGGNGGDLIKAGLNSESIDGGSGSDVLQANRSQASADAHATFQLDGAGGTNALYGGGAFNTFFSGDTNGGRNQIHGGLSLMSDVAGTTNNTVDYSFAIAGHSVYVGLLNGHNAYIYAGDKHSGALTFEDSIQNVPNVIGSDGGDLIRADNGTDVIQGGGGGDILYAGTGFDTFVYSGYSDSNTTTGYDSVSGFATGKDKLDLSGLNSDPTHLAILSGSNSTVLYLEATPGKFTAATDLAISFTGAKAITASDVIF